MTQHSINRFITVYKITYTIKISRIDRLYREQLKIKDKDVTVENININSCWNSDDIKSSIFDNSVNIVVSNSIKLNRNKNLKKEIAVIKFIHDFVATYLLTTEEKDVFDHIPFESFMYLFIDTNDIDLDSILCYSNFYERKKRTGLYKLFNTGDITIDIINEYMSNTRKKDYLNREFSDKELQKQENRLSVEVDILRKIYAKFNKDVDWDIKDDATKCWMELC